MSLSSEAEMVESIAPQQDINNNNSLMVALSNLEGGKNRHTELDDRSKRRKNDSGISTQKESDKETKTSGQAKTPQRLSSKIDEKQPNISVNDDYVR